MLSRIQGISLCKMKPTSRRRKSNCVVVNCLKIFHVECKNIADIKARWCGGSVCADKLEIRLKWPNL